MLLFFTGFHRLKYVVSVISPEQSWALVSRWYIYCLGCLACVEICTTVSRAINDPLLLELIYLDTNFCISLNLIFRKFCLQTSFFVLKTREGE